MSVDEHADIWLRIRGSREAIAALGGTEAAVMRLSRATKWSGINAKQASERNWLLNQSLFTMRRYAYAATLALTGTAFAAIRLGYNYFTTMQQAGIAFKGFLGTQTAVNKELRLLYRLAAFTPLEFTDITTAARRFLGFGFTVEQTNRTLKNTVDALAAVGLSSGQYLNRASLALAHMNAIGRLTGQVAYQLARDNIPIYKALEEELGLSGDQMRRLGTLRIPASVALEALNRYIEKSPQYAGAAYRLSLHSLHGLLSTTKDFAAQLFGTIEKPWFLGIQKMLGGKTGQQGLVRTLNLLQQAYLRGGWTEMFGELGRSGRVGAFIAPSLLKIVSAVHSLWMIFSTGLLPALRTLSPEFKAFGAILGILAGVLGFVARQGFLLHYVLVPLIGLWALERFMVILDTIAIIGNNIVRAAGRPIIAAYNIARLAGLIIINKEIRAMVLDSLLQNRRILRLIRLTTLTRLFTAEVWASARAENGRFIAGYRYNTLLDRFVRNLRGVWIPAMVAFNKKLVATIFLWVRLKIATMAATVQIFLFRFAVVRATFALIALRAAILTTWIALLLPAEITGGIAALIVALVALPIILGVLYWKWRAFRLEVNRMFGFFKKNWQWLRYPFIAAFAPIIGAINLVQTMIRWVRILYNLVRHPLRIHIGGGGGPLGVAGRVLRTIDPVRKIPGGSFLEKKFHVPWAASGGDVMSGGSLMVGERGPEIVTLPMGAQISPAGTAHSAGFGSQSFPSFPSVINLHAVLKVDGRELAKVVASQRLDQVARA